MSSSIPPPFYILVSPAASGNDPPTALLPTAQNPNIFILEPNVSNVSTPQEPHFQSSSPPAISVSSAATIMPSGSRADLPVVQSLSSSFAVTSVRMAHPPAAAVAYAANQGQDPNIYIIDYAPARAPDDAHRMESSIRERSTTALLAQFHQRNSLLRSVLNAPDPRNSSANVDSNKAALSL